MKRFATSISLILTGVLFLFTASAFAGPTPDPDSVLSEAIKEADGSSGQDTNSGSGVKTGHIQDGAITSSKLSLGAVEPSKISFYQNVIIVAPSGGDFNSPVSAVNYITDASASNPYLVKIMPGVYNIGSTPLTMKAYVDIEGSGENVTRIKGNVEGNTPSNLGVVMGASNSEIRYLTVEHTGGVIHGKTISNVSTSPKISHITVLASGSGVGFGFFNKDSLPVITDVTITVSGSSRGLGIYNQSSSAVITDVVINASGGSYDNMGLWNINCSPILRDMVVNVSGSSNYNYGVENSTDSNGSGDQVTMKDLKVNVSGGNYNYGVYNGQDSVTLTSILLNVTIVTSGGTNNIGVRSTGSQGQSFVKINNSTIQGATNTISNSFGSVMVGSTLLDGGSVADPYGTVTCAGVYDEAYTFYASMCP